MAEGINGNGHHTERDTTEHNREAPNTTGLTLRGLTLRGLTTPEHRPPLILAFIGFNFYQFC